MVIGEYLNFLNPPSPAICLITDNGVLEPCEVTPFPPYLLISTNKREPDKKVVLVARPVIDLNSCSVHGPPSSSGRGGEASGSANPPSFKVLNHSEPEPCFSHRSSKFFLMS